MVKILYRIPSISDNLSFLSTVHTALVNTLWIGVPGEGHAPFKDTILRLICKQREDCGLFVRNPIRNRSQIVGNAETDIIDLIMRFHCIFFI